MTKYFAQDTPRAGLERMMMSVPGFQRRGGGTMILSRFRYKPEDVACRYCLHYRRRSCQIPICPYIAERLKSGAIGYRDLILECFGHIPHAGLRKRIQAVEHWDGPDQVILRTVSRGNEHERVHLRLPASPAEIGEAFVILDGISLDTTTTAILDVRGNVPGLYRYLYDVDVEDSEQFQKLQQLAERTDALSPEKAAIFSGALDAEHAENLDEALAVANRLDEYMLIGNITSDSELGAYLVDKGITPFPDRFKPYINYARVGAEYREKHDGVYANGSYVQKKALELLGNEPLDAVFRVRLKNICSKGAKNEIVQIMLPATFEQLESARQFLGIDSLNMVKLVQVEALRPYLGEHLPLHGTDMRLEQLDELAENIRQELNEH